MDRTYESAATLAGRATGPLVSHLVTFVASLIDQQFTASVIYIKVQHALAFDRWLAERGVVLPISAKYTSSVTSTGVGFGINASAPRLGTTRTMSRPPTGSH